MNFQQAAALVIFCGVVLLTVLLVLVPVTVQLPAAWTQRLRIQSISFSYAGAPVLGTLVMVATGSLDGDSLAAGIVGDANMKPYGIVILFMALAYMSTSLDMTGCFQWVALQLTRLSKGNGLTLFLLYYTLSSALTVFTSNDVSIMTLTPIIHYFSLATDADPIPFLTAEFTAANIWSMLLFVGNPTNIIVAMAYRLSFLEYTRWMALPTIAAGMAALAAVLLVHKPHIPRTLQLPDVQPAAMLVDKPGALLGAANILVCLGLLAAAPALHWELWLVTLVCAVLHAAYNFVAYVVFKGRWCADSSRQGAQAGTGPSAVERCIEAGEVPAGSSAAAAAAAESAVEMVTPGSAAEGGTMSGAYRRHHQQQQMSCPNGCMSQPGLCRAGAVLADSAGSTPAAAAATHAARPGAAADVALQRCCLEDSSAAAGARAPVDLFVDAEGGVSDGPHVGLRSRTCSRQQLLTTQQQMTCSDGLCASCSGGEVEATCPGGCADCKPCCQGASQQLTTAPPIAAAARGSANAGGAAGSSSPRLQPPPAPSFWRAVTVLPWEIVPFVLGMFCVVEGLNATGWVDALAAWLAGSLGGSVWGALFGVGGLSVLLANIINNQPMTILMTRVCMSPAFIQPLASTAAATPIASAFAVVVASNTAANFSVMGALAGIMFVNILQQRGMKSLGYVRFSKLMFPAGMVSTIFALVVLGAEFVTWRM